VLLMPVVPEWSSLGLFTIAALALLLAGGAAGACHAPINPGADMVTSTFHAD
jgi:hypothetical protein